MAYYRSDQALINVSVSGTNLNAKEAWDVFEGGEKKSAGLKIFPGGMAEQEELGGTPERETIKVQRKWADPLIAVFKELDAAVGSGEATVSVTTLNSSGKPIEDTVTYTGVLLEVARPKYKAGPATESLLEVTIGPNGAIT